MKQRPENGEVFLAAGMFLLLALAVPSPAVAADKADAAPAARATRVTVVTVKREELVESVAVNGNLVAKDEVMIGPEIEGLRVIEILAEEGDKVLKGQVLARLNRETLDAQLAQNDAALQRWEAAIAQAKSQIQQSEASLRQSQQQLERSNELRKSGFVSQATLDQQINDERANTARLAASRDALRVSEADLASIAAQRRELQVRISRAEVRAPAAGVISRRSVKIGAVASMASEPMFRVIADGDIELEAEVSETRINRLSVGQPATIASGGITGAGKVRLVSPEVDRLTRLARVRVAVDSDSGLRIGSFARGMIETRRANAVAVPVSAILYGEKGPFVQVVTQNRIAAAPVSLGIITALRAEVIAGVAEGATIVLKAGAFLVDGDIVDPREDGQVGALSKAGAEAGARP